MKMSTSFDTHLVFPSTFKMGPFKTRVTKNGMLMTEIAPPVHFSVSPRT